MAPFRGWSHAAFDFYRQLEADNCRDFFVSHRAVYDTEVKAPLDALSELVAAEFGRLRVFRPNRDIRFSRDKAPYKTRCYGVAEGEGGESFFVEMSAAGLVSGTGYWMMANDQLARFRRAVDDDTSGPALESAIVAVRKKRVDVEAHGLKTAPRGYPRDHPRVELLRLKSVAGMKRFEPAAWMGTRAAAKRITDVWRAGRPINEWLAAHVGPSTEPPPEARP
jgi:uncharacterized protein (TIGR02453 family)